MNAYLRVKILIIVGGLIVNAVIFFVTIQRDLAFDFSKLVVLFLLNMLFLIPFLYIISLQKKGIQIDAGLESDLNLKKQGHLLIGLVTCPNCKNRTISKPHAIRSPQTCGECGRRYRISKHKDYSKYTLAGFFIIFTSIIYLRDFGSLDPRIGRYLGVASVILFFLSLGVPLLQKIKLEEVKNHSQ